MEKRKNIRNTPNKRVTKTELVDIVFRIAEMHHTGNRLPVYSAWIGYIADKKLTTTRSREIWKDFANAGRICGVSVIRREKETWFENGVKLEM